MKSEWKLIKSAAKGLILLSLAVLACRFSKGAATGALAAVAVVCGFSGRLGWAMTAYVFFPMLVILNPAALPMGGLSGIFARGGCFLLSIVLMFSAAQRHGNHAIPLNGLWIYLLIAVVSSMGGYAPMVSYLKIISFALFLVGLGIGFRNIDKRINDLRVVRTFFLAFVLFVIFGSYAVKILMPGAAYLATMRLTATQGIEEATARVIESGGGLFAGILNQSQCLAVVLPCCLAWLICDMLFVERRITKFHLGVFGCGIPLVYWTGSRAAFLATAVAGFLIYFYCLGKINISRRVRSSLRMAMTMGIVAIVAVCGVMEVKNHAMTKWLRKTQDVESDARGFGEAFTESRMGLVEANLFDFRQNPVFGSGFQVSYEMKNMFKDASFVLSAPIEKGVLPLMVLGETGIVGEIVFIIFLLTFYWTCARKRYHCTLTLMTVMIFCNMAEANFFSPGGVGGMLWMICIGGGFLIDTISLYWRRIERDIAKMERMQAMQMGWAR